MAFIKLKNESLPGIVGLLDYRPETAQWLLGLAEELLRKESTLSSGERELIAASVSYWNECEFCYKSHAAIAANLLDINFEDLMYQIETGYNASDKPVQFSVKLRHLLFVAFEVVKNKYDKFSVLVSINRAKIYDATDMEIHDTILIASAFCMYNRYVANLDTLKPQNNNDYVSMAKRLVEQGYKM